MRKSKTGKNSRSIAAILIAVSVSFFTLSCAKAGKADAGKIAPAPPASTQEFVDTVKGDTIKGDTIKGDTIKGDTIKAGTVEIKEKMFIAQVNDVYLNTDEYLGKTIKLEGIFRQDVGVDKLYRFVFRYGPGCCGNDGVAGFEVAWAEEKAKPYPPDDSWVEAIGVLKMYEKDEFMQYVYLDLSSLTVLSRRGAEFVMQ